MTIIITCVDEQGQLHIVADAVERDDEGPSIVSKIYACGSEAQWAAAGQAPSREMILATTIEQLVKAASLWAAVASCNQLIIAETSGNTARLWMSQNDGDKLVLNEVQSGRSCIGSYRSEWSDYSERVRSDQERYRRAKEFCGLISQLSLRQELFQDVSCGFFDRLEVFQRLDVSQNFSKATR